MYSLTNLSLSSSCPIACLSEHVSPSHWHSRLCHPSLQISCQVISKSNLATLSNKFVLVCNACQVGKSHRLSFMSSRSMFVGTLDLIRFIDVWGLEPKLSINDNIYYVSLLMIFEIYLTLSYIF